MERETTESVPAAANADGFDNTTPSPPAQTGALKPVRRRRWLRPVLLLLGPLLVITAGGYMYATSGRYVSTENAYVKADKIAVSADVSGRVVMISVRENDIVRASQALFQIDKRPFEIALEHAAAELGIVANEIESYRAAYNQQLTELKIARDDLEFSEREFRRQQRLVDRGIVSESQYDEARHRMEIAQKKVTATEAEIVHVLADLGGDPDIKVEEHPRYHRALATRDQALLDLSRTTIRAPANGVVGNIALQAGEYVEEGKALFSLVSTDSLWINVNLKETDLTHVLVGQLATVSADAYPDKEWQAVVDSISPATGAEFSLLPPQNASGNWVKVVQRIPVRVILKDQTSSDLPLRAGMSVQVSIDTRYERPLPGIVRSALAWLNQTTASDAASDESASALPTYQ
jgi:membrane fusion protein (multidrug efflux system)